MLFMVPKNFGLQDEYDKGFRLSELVPLDSMGVTTGNDAVLVSQNQKNLLLAIENVLGAEVDHKYIKKILYRPFDEEFVYYKADLLARAREKFMANFRQENLGICLVKICSRDDELPVFCTTKITDKTLLSSKDNCNVFPLYLYDTAVEPPSRRVNFVAAIYKKICKAAGLKFSDQDLQATACKHGAKSSACKSCPEDSNPQLVFDYIYAVLHSGKYRKKYAEFLKIDFPRIPYPKNGEEFRTMAAFGAELRRIHCMEDFDEAAEVELVGGDGAPGGRALPVKPTVVKPVWKDGGVYIDKEVKFTNVAEDLWNFHIGGYQPLQKWLKDRKGRELSAEDVSHYKRMVRAIARTRDIMAKIDASYEV